MTAKQVLLVLPVISALLISCASAPKTESEPVADSTPAPETDTVQSSDGETQDDLVPDFQGYSFNAFSFRQMKPRIVEIRVDSHRQSSLRAHNKVNVEQAVRAALESALARSKVQVVSRSQNKIQFDLKDCKALPNPGDCVAIEAVFRSPRFELEVGGYSQISSTRDSQNPTTPSDIARAYVGAINAVMERLNKQLEIVGMNQ